MILTTSLTQLPLHLPIGVSLSDGVSLVVEPLALCQSDLQLGLIPLDVDAEGYDSEPFFLHVGGQSRQLSLMQQQSAISTRIVVVSSCMIVRSNVG
jgi:hypothetical protein